jgi:hypothetical protein
MKRTFILFIILILQIPLSAYSKDPTSKSECISMLAPQLQIQCSTLLGEKPEMLAVCLENIASETEKQCDRFFGGSNFCSTCTSECIRQFKEADPTRVECLETCFSNPACKKKK